ncbi:MAG: Cytochrome biosis protein [Bacteroidetes bacterium]|nr:Cytochrome biosis protein [Bacteroidota bacterium]
MTLDLFVDVLVAVMPLVYAIVVILYGVSFFKGALWADRIKTPALITAIGCHLLHILVRTVVFDHLPVTTVFEIMTTLAFCIVIAYAYIEWKTKATNTGFFILLLAFIFQTASSLFIKDLLDIAPILRSRLLGFHVSSALLGYTAISLSAVYGILYLMLYHEIKSSRFGRIYNRLPNLEMLEKMSHKAEVFGFIMLTIAICVGLFWLPRAFEDFSYWDPKLIGSLMIWALYAVGLSAKRKLGWQGKRTMILSVVAFAFVFLSMTVINLYLSGFHSFH